MAKEVQADPQFLASHLNALHSRGLLLVATRDGVAFCQYGPATPELCDQVGRLLQVYRERPVTLIRIVSTRPAQALTTFAEAFRLRKEV